MKSQGKITDFHTAGTEVPTDHKEEELDTLTNATGLERAEAPVVHQQPQVSEPAQTQPPVVESAPEQPKEILRSIAPAMAVAVDEVPGVIDVREAIEAEEAVSEVIEDVVVDAVHYAQEHDASPAPQQPAPASAPVSSPLPQAPVPQPVQKPEAQKEDDDGLYSIRNFSL